MGSRSAWVGEKGKKRVVFDPKRLDVLFMKEKAYCACVEGRSREPR